MSFERNLQQWVSVDNEIKQLANTMKTLREQKNTLTTQITEHATNNNLTNAVVKIGDGQLKFITLKETQTLTFKYLETCLSEIIKNEDQVKKIVEYVKHKRDIKYVPEIKRLYNN